jgi:hypothetical protein
MSTAVVDNHHLSALSPYQSYSNTTSPSALTTPAGQTYSDNSAFSEYDFAADDEFFGGSFDIEEQLVDIGSNQTALRDIPLPTTELAVHESFPTPQYGIHTASSDIIDPPQTEKGDNTDALGISAYHGGTHGVLSMATVALSEPCEAIYNTMPGDESVAMDGVRRLSNYSPHSQYDGVGIEFGGEGHPTSPGVTLTQWESQKTTALPTDVEQEMDIDKSWNNTSSSVDASTEQASSMSATHGSNEQSGSSETSRRRGMDPERRKSLSDVELPSLKDQEKDKLLRERLVEVEAWRSKAELDPEDASHTQSRSTLALPGAGNRPRASTTSALPTSHPAMDLVPDLSDAAAILSLSDDELTPTENQYKDALYFNPDATHINESDRKAMLPGRHWSDSPRYPYITTNTNNEPMTANEAMKKFQDEVDGLSMLSRSATWGTRRRSEPSIAEIESINNGSLFKRLSFGKQKEKRPSLGSKLSGLVRKKSDSKESNLKRKSSKKSDRAVSENATTIKEELQYPQIGGLAVPASRRRGPASPRLDTNLAAPAAHARGHSVSAASTGGKGFLGTMGQVIRRARSNSNLQPESGIASLWVRESGGPPVPTLASPPIDEPLAVSQTFAADNIKQQDDSDAEGEDDDDLDEEPVEEGEAMEFDALPITSNMQGFQEHVRRLYPDMKHDYLIDRIAHQQVVRYKALLKFRVKHRADIAGGSCTAGKHCIELGGSPTVLQPKNQPRAPENANTLHPDADGSEGDSNPEGTLTPESFPRGVPLPPTATLPAEFECKLCFRVKKFQKPSDWTKHVHEDVAPFTCTYSNCKEPKSFKRKADWVRHENERHRHLSWWTCTVEECQHKCYRKDNFIQHLVREHKIAEPKGKSKGATKKAGNSEEEIWRLVRDCHHETTNRPQDEPCKFCGKTMNTWKKLTVHLAKHMEGISLSVLRLVDQAQVDANTIISPVEPLVVRQQPVTPVGLDRHISASSGGYSHSNSDISPHILYSADFSSSMYPQVSPLAQHSIQFGPVNMVSRDMSYGPNDVTSRDMSVNMMANMDPEGFTYNESTMPFAPVPTSLGYIPQSQGFQSMDHSPLLNQGQFFTATNGFLPTTPVPQQQQNFRSYPTSSATLSPAPNMFDISTPYPTHNITPNMAQSGFTTGPHQPSGFPQSNFSMADEMYPNTNMSYDPNSIMPGAQQRGSRGSLGSQYTPTSHPGYGRCQQ